MTIAAILVGSERIEALKAKGRRLGLVFRAIALGAGLASVLACDALMPRELYVTVNPLCEGVVSDVR
jgi:hypothetical protein